MTEASNYNMTAGGGSPGKDPASADVKYLSIVKISEGSVLLNLPSASTKKAYAEEVRTEMSSRKILCKVQKGGPGPCRWLERGDCLPRLQRHLRVRLWNVVHHD